MKLQMPLKQLKNRQSSNKMQGALELRTWQRQLRIVQPLRALREPLKILPEAFAVRNLGLRTLVLRILQWISSPMISLEQVH